MNAFLLNPIFRFFFAQKCWLFYYIGLNLLTLRTHVLVIGFNLFSHTQNKNDQFLNHVIPISRDA